MGMKVIVLPLVVILFGLSDSAFSQETSCSSILKASPTSGSVAPVPPGTLLSELKIETDLVTIRTIQAGDAENYRNVTKNVLVKKMANDAAFDDMSDREVARDFKDALKDSRKKSESYMAAIVDKKSGQTAGFIYLTFEDQPGVAEIAYELLPQFWGRGIASASVDAFITGAGKYLKLSKIVAKAALSNVGSQKVLEKSGFSFDHTEKPDLDDVCRNELDRVYIRSVK